MINSDSLIKLEFGKVLDRISRFANSDATRGAVCSIVPLGDRSEIQSRFGRVEEIRALAAKGVPLRLAAFDDILSLLDLLRPVDAILNPIDLHAFIPAFQVLRALSKQLDPRQDIPLLREMTGPLTGFPDILEALERTVDRDGGMLDTASRLLYEIREKKRGITSRIRRRLEEIVREKSVAIFLQDDFITQRSGRWVIPVRMDSKGMVPGVVHDVSNTGETAFMEPIEIIALANELENLAADEKAEQIRILREICGWLREDAVEIEAEFRALIRIDTLNCIAGYADIMAAEVPVIDAGGAAIRLVQARHPILLLMEKECGGARVVPLDFFLSYDTNERVMVITGPNTGGKTIAIKTAGLLTMMALSGIAVPAESTSVFPLLTDILVDIGDEQAIESSLSTFSSHISRISAIIAGAGPSTMVLLDELGTGTEPVQGAALACSILKELYDRGALVLATTHLTEIVGFVHRTDGMQNAAMEFDRTTLLPLYRLKAGEPGESHAIETARRYGLPDHLIDYAQSLVGTVGSEFHALLAELKEQRYLYESRLAALDAREAAVSALEERQRELLADAEERRRASMENGLREARELVQAARRDLNQILDEAKREKREASRERLLARERQIEEALRKSTGEKSPSVDEIREGARVSLRSLGCEGVVLKVDRKQGRVRVQAGSMEMELPIGDIVPLSGKGKSGDRHRTGSGGGDVEYPREINLLGQRVDEATALLEPFLNHASLSGYGEVRVIHGVGTGALKRGVRQYLSGHPLVAGFRDGESFEGRGGVTVVSLK